MIFSSCSSSYIYRYRNSRRCRLGLVNYAPNIIRFYTGILAQINVLHHGPGDIFSPHGLYFVQVVDKCSFSNNLGTHYSNQIHFKLSPSNSPLKFISIHLLGPFPRSKKGNQHIFIITYLYSKL